MRERPNISEDYLRACLQDHYGVSAVALEFLPRGLDMKAGVYRILSSEGAAYLLKVKSGLLYEAGCLVPRYLHDQGITAVVAPLRTRRDALWVPLEGPGEWTAILYPFIEGDVGWSPGMTAAQWEAAGAAFRAIHQVPLTPKRFPMLRRETFDPTEYARWVRTFDEKHARAGGGSGVERELRERWNEHRPTIHALLATMEALAPVLHQRSGQRVVCHADLHPSNIIRHNSGHVFVIDWDDVMLAPKERDFLFVGDPPADGLTADGGSPFFAGYGPAEIDWVALTYYRCERVVQDVISFPQEVYLQDDLGEDTKAESARLFGVLFAPGTMIEAAQVAAAHLPRALKVPISP